MTAYGRKRTVILTVLGVTERLLSGKAVIRGAGRLLGGQERNLQDC